jgi:mRNA-degrading endonuclease RelE of RelBE toxin-antitoxin system
MAWTIEYTPDAEGHLSMMRTYDQRIIYGAIGRQLKEQADVPSRHRKELRDNALAGWELRVGNFRVFYDVKKEENRVLIVALGIKRHNVLYIAGEEIQL